MQGRTGLEALKGNSLTSYWWTRREVVRGAGVQEVGLCVGVDTAGCGVTRNAIMLKNTRCNVFCVCAICLKWLFNETSGELPCEQVYKLLHHFAQHLSTPQTTRLVQR